MARDRDLDVATTVLPLDYLPRALAARVTRGLIKLVAERTTKRLLGAHILAPEGADAIQTAALAIKHGMTYIELAEMIFRSEERRGGKECLSTSRSRCVPCH